MDCFAYARNDEKRSCVHITILGSYDGFREELNPLRADEKLAEKFDHVLASSLGRFGVIGGGGATVDTRVGGSGGLARIAVDDHAQRLFLEEEFSRRRA